MSRRPTPAPVLVSFSLALMAAAGCTSLLQGSPPLGGASPGASPAASTDPSGSPEPATPSPTAPPTSNSLAFALTISAEAGTNLFPDRPAATYFNGSTTMLSASVRYTTFFANNQGARTEKAVFANMSTTDLAKPAVGKTYTMGAYSTPSWLQFEETATTGATTTKHTWGSSGGTIELTAVSGTNATFTLHDVTMVPDNTLSSVSTGNFTLNGTMRINLSGL